MVKANMQSDIPECLGLVIDRLNGKRGVSTLKTGEKGELIECITHGFDSWKLAQNEVVFTLAKGTTNRIT
jgi:hypothetical protein